MYVKDLKSRMTKTDEEKFDELLYNLAVGLESKDVDALKFLSSFISESELETITSGIQLMNAYKRYDFLNLDKLKSKLTTVARIDLANKLCIYEETLDKTMSLLAIKTCEKKLIYSLNMEMKF